MKRNLEGSSAQKTQFVKNLLSELKADGVETSFELEGFLQTRYSKSETLQQKVLEIVCH